MKKTHKTFSDMVTELPGGEALKMCYACGTCVSRCMVQDRQEPTYNPRQVIKKAALDMADAVLNDKTPWLCSACDLCYPACPQKIHISKLLLALRRMAIDAGHATVVQTAVVDGLTCVACGLCVSVCPYDAIALDEVKVFGKDKVIAVVEPHACMGCGLCGAHCRSASIGLPEGFSNEGVVEDLWRWIERTEK